jgi:hypothetical protein
MNELAIAHSLEDYGLSDRHHEVIEAMATRLKDVVAKGSAPPPDGRIWKIGGETAERSIVYDNGAGDLEEAVVFAGFRRPNVSRAVIENTTRTDARLRQLLARPVARREDKPVASYSSKVVPDSRDKIDPITGDWANLVVPMNGIAEFGKQPVHRYAADILAPQLYSKATVLIVRFPGGVTSGNPLEVLQSTIHTF